MNLCIHTGCAEYLKLSRRLFFSFLLICLTLCSYGQRAYHKYARGYVGDVPKAATFSPVGELDNVDHQTGTLQVTVPIYTIKTGDLELPINLYYSATGIKVGQERSIAGMGWQLNAGGKIVTSVIGLNDDHLNGINNDYSAPWKNQPYNNVNLNVDHIPHRQYIIDLLSGWRDGALDIYHYQLPSISGSFVFSGADYLTFPYRPSVYASGHMIKHDGKTYEFVDGDVKHTRKRTFYTEAFPPDTSMFTKAWRPEDEDQVSNDRNLRYILSESSNDSISFDYHVFSSHVQAHLPVLNNLDKITTSASMPMSKDVTRDTYGNWVAGTGYFIKAPTFTQTKIMYKQLTRIKQINFREGRVVFEYTNGFCDFLSSIKIERKLPDNTFELLRKFVFEKTPESMNYLFLGRITEEDGSGNFVGSWAFKYNNEAGLSNNPLTTEHSGEDRWGFYNGAGSNKIMIENPHNNIAIQNKRYEPIYIQYNSTSPSTSLHIPNRQREGIELYGKGVPYGQFSFANREFNFEQAMTGMLASIVTPSRSIVEYEYEPHKFVHYRPSSGNSYTETIKQGGGMRIKQITTSDYDVEGGYASTLRSKKVFKYGSGGAYQGNEDGVGKVSYPATIISTNSVYPAAYGVNIGTTVGNFQLLSHSIKDMTLKGGSYAVYGSVSEYVYKSQNDVGAKTTYLFYLPAMDQWTEGQGFSYPVGDNSGGIKPDYIYNHPKSVIRYKSWGSNVYSAVQRTEYAYKQVNAPLVANPGRFLSILAYNRGILAAPFLQSYTVHYMDHNGDLQTSTGTSVIKFIDPIAAYIRSKDHPDFYYPGKYGYDAVYLGYNSTAYVKTQERNYVYGDNNILISQDTVNYVYDSPRHLNPNQISRLNSQGDSVLHRFIYPLDVSNPSNGSSASYLINRHLLDRPLEEYKYLKKGNDRYLTAGTTYDYGVTVQGKLYLSNELELKLTQPITGSPTNWWHAFTVKRVDPFGRILELEIDQLKSYALIWGYGNSQITASVNNAIYTDVAFSGFESTDKGNWSYSGTPNFAIGSVTGSGAYNLTTGAISKSQLDPSKKYVLMYWLKNGGVVNIAGGTVGAAESLVEKNGWQLIRRNISASEGVTLSGSGIIDDLRLHPYDAGMTTYTYSNLQGISSITDNNGTIKYFGYDGAGRLRDILDFNRNIRERYRYHLPY
ncbi:hypothetical protein FAZ15_16195 [Sphingobacterium olei]|uniref:RHS repeat protein n=1 Tax=Sphingobacterium olei TaxID=2571155 RepID=A0A4U0NHC9_9SPHI|nr:hypothetical protein [Sphingobacterium olei]TJZ53579.1 hypothetical protein FAZ15_16195 [Sphingobacterium olei]